jgi:hypothetical protein
VRWDAPLAAIREEVRGMNPSGSEGTVVFFTRIKLMLTGVGSGALWLLRARPQDRDNKCRNSTEHLSPLPYQ